MREVCVKRKKLPDRREHITQRVKIGNIRTLYLSVDNEESPNEIFLRIRGDTGNEKVCCYDVIARLMSLAIQAGIPMQDIAERLQGTRTEPAGQVSGDDRIKFCDGTIDYIGRHLLVNYCGRDDLAHAKKKDSYDETGDPGS